MSAKGKVTIHDIALLLKVTASTVSRALHDHPNISERTKKAVLEAAQQLNYQPNNIAAALRKGKSHIIGLIVPTVNRAFFASVIRGIEEIANQKNYKVIICQTYDNYKKEVQMINTLLNAQVDGIIASIGKNTLCLKHFEKVQHKGIPLVLFDRTTKALDVCQVGIDDYLGSYKMVSHLITEGNHRIAHFAGSQKVNIFKERLRGYKNALLDHGIAFDKRLVVESDLQLEGGRQCMQKLLATGPVPDAVFSASDYGAMGAMQVLKEEGFSIPGEIALAGFSNEPFTSFTDPPLSTVDQLSIKMGKTTAEVFFHHLQAGDTGSPQEITTLDPEILIRESSLRTSACQSG